MAVSPDVRAAELEIDNALRALPLWRCPKAEVITALLEYYREATESVGLLVNFFSLEPTDDPKRGIFITLLTHQRWQAGVFWAIKWALLYCSDAAAESFTTEMIHDAQELGQRYEALVDALRFAKHDVVFIEADRTTRTMMVYEGGDQTGADWAMIEHQRQVNLVRAHADLTHDEDQLTSRWTAGDFRRAVAWLVAVVDAAQGDEIVLDRPEHAGRPIPLFKQPKIVAIPDPDPVDTALSAVLDDLTVTSTKLDGRGLYRYDSWPDTPLVMINGVRFGASDIVTSLRGPTAGERMLRLAARVDSRQYSTVSGLREDRMMEVCRLALQRAGWSSRTRYRLTEPPQEIDVYACRSGKRLILSLKSTLRPQAAREVYDRNSDLREGIRQAVSARDRLGRDVSALVITDGYRGDYLVWAEALRHGIAIGTLGDLETVVQDPVAAVGVLKARAGLNEDSGVESAGNERRFTIGGWTVRIVDVAAPSQ